MRTDLFLRLCAGATALYHGDSGIVYITGTSGTSSSCQEAVELDPVRIAKWLYMPGSYTDCLISFASTDTTVMT